MNYQGRVKYLSDMQAEKGTHPPPPTPPWKDICQVSKNDVSTHKEMSLDKLDKLDS